MTVLNILGVLFLMLWLLLSVLNLWYLVAVPPAYLTPQKRGGPRCKGCAGYVGVECVVKMAALLLSFSLYIACLTSARFTHTYSHDRPSYVLVPGPSW